MLSNVGNGWDFKIKIKDVADRIEKVINEPDTREGHVLNWEAADQFDADPKAFWAQVRQSVKNLTFD